MCLTRPRMAAVGVNVNIFGRLNIVWLLAGGLGVREK